MSVQKLAVKVNREIAENIIRTVTAMPEEKVTWRPMDEGRDALDMLIEVAEINFMGARVFQDRAVPTPDPEQRERMRRETDTREKGIALLRSSVDALAAAIEAFPDEHLDDTLQIRIFTKSFAELMVFVYAHSSYHFGQINYVQTLYGDREMHI